MQLFLKRVRKHYGSGIRFFLCGEYGDSNNRPHYHALLFGLTLTDRLVHKRHRDHVLYQSPTLTEIWGKGYITLGDVTMESAAYVARYITKKQTGPAAIIYEPHISDDGEVFDKRHPPFVTMSRRDGIGKRWVLQFTSDVFPHDHIVDIEGNKHPVPRYYENVLTERTLRRLKGERIQRAKEHADNNTPARLKVREEVQLARLNSLKREL